MKKPTMKVSTRCSTSNMFRAPEHPHDSGRPRGSSTSCPRARYEKEEGRSLVLFSVSFFVLIFVSRPGLQESLCPWPMKGGRHALGGTFPAPSSAARTTHMTSPLGGIVSWNRALWQRFLSEERVAKGLRSADALIGVVVEETTEEVEACRREY